MSSQAVWEQRWHPLREEWVLYTSHRGGRPWVGEMVTGATEHIPSYDPSCALCPRNARLKGSNPDYQGTFLFTNDLPCFSEEETEFDEGGGLRRRKSARGTAEVICYHPDHSKTFAQLTPPQATEVVRLWKQRQEIVGARPEVEHVLIFENKGSAVGTSNPHPHCQIYAGNMIYQHTAREVESSRRYLAKTGRHLGMDILASEEAEARLIARNDAFTAFVPWFARYAYEVMIFPRRPMASLVDLSSDEEAHLGEIMREVAIRYDNLWRMPMPYVMAFHQAPTDGGDYSAFPFHIEFHPPLRKPDTLKYLAGPEIGGGSMTNESNPDEKAAELQAVDSVHYLEKSR